jgi:ankyrin repeat protein
VIKNDLGMATLLLDHGADGNARGHSGETALHMAAARGYREMTELLLERGADVESRDQAGESPLNEAAAHGYAVIVGLLLAHGARVDAANPETGSTALIEAAARG